MRHEPILTAVAAMIFEKGGLSAAPTEGRAGGLLEYHRSRQLADHLPLWRERCHGRRFSRLPL